jgi:hypothetical protein
LETLREVAAVVCERLTFPQPGAHFRAIVEIVWAIKLGARWKA